MTTGPGPLADPGFLTDFPFNIGVRVLGPGIESMRPTAEQREHFQRYRTMGDPLADGVVEMFRRLPGGEGRRLFELALERGIDAVDGPPEELVAFFDQVDTVPYWLDRQKLDRGARAFGRAGIAVVVALSGLALNAGYLSGRAAKTLTAGDLVAMAPRRMAETTMWAIDVTTPGGMERFSTGFKSVVRVRLMHAMVRGGLNRRSDWNYEDWDHPVNQFLTVETLMLFSLTGNIGSQLLGFRFSKKEKEGNYHLWRYVGHVLGVDPQILPANEADNWRLLWLGADYDLIPDEDSRRLSEALFTVIPTLMGIEGDERVKRMLSNVLANYVGSYSRIVMGKENADALGTPYSAPYIAAVAATALATMALEVPRRLIPGATSLSETVGRRSQRWLATYILENTRGDRTYRRHDGFSPTRAA